MTTVDSRKIPNEEKTPKQDRHSNHTFTPPTSCSSHNSSNDLHLTSSTRSIDLPQLKYAIEQFLVDDDNPIYQIADEFPSGYSQGKTIHLVSFPILSYRLSSVFKIIMAMVLVQT